MINDKGEWEQDPPSLCFCVYCGNLYVINMPITDKRYYDLNLSEALKEVGSSCCRNSKCQLLDEREGHNW